MQASIAKRVLVVVIAVFSLSSMVGCARILGVEKSSAARNGDYYPTCLVKADQALDEARMAGKDKQCPDEFNALKDTVDRAYKLHLACNTEGACKMANEAVGRMKALCPGRQEKVCITLEIEFDTNKADIKSEYHDEIGKVAAFMKKYPDTNGVIEGHTDDVGGYDDNIKLSERRAASVKNYLIEKYGIAPERLSSKGYGYTKPVADNKTIEGRQKNRRIEANFDCIIIRK